MKEALEFIIDNFIEISKIIRPSGREINICDYFEDIAKNNNLEVYRDEYNNILITKEGNIKSKESLCLVSHLDMIYRKENKKAFDFEKDEIKLLVDNDKIFSKNTTAGLSSLYALSIMKYIIENNIEMPTMEFLLVSNDEKDKSGIINFDYSKIKSKKIIDLSLDIDKKVAIGAYKNIVLKIHIDPKKLVKMDVDGYEITLSNAEGNKVDKNAIKELAKCLRYAKVYISEINSVDSLTCKAKIVTDIEGKDNLRKNIGLLLPKSLKLDIKNTIVKKYLQLEDSKKLLNLLLELEQGNINKDDTLLGNISNIDTNNGKITFSYHLKGFDENKLNETYSLLDEKLNLLKIKFEKVYEDNKWEEDIDKSKLLKEYKEVYYSLYKKLPEEIIYHGDIDASIIKKHLNDIEMISIGVNIEDKNKVKETLTIDSLEKITNILFKLFAK